MYCQKFEARRPELSSTGYPDGCSINYQRAGKDDKQAGIDFVKLEDEEFDPTLGDSTGAGVIFGATGGVMEAALRTVYELVTGKSIENLEINAVRGLDGVKEVEVPLGDITIKAAVAHGTANARALLEKVKSGEKEYHFIEVMGCPGGCVTGADNQLYLHGSDEMMLEKYELQFMMKTDHCLFENPMRIPQLRRFEEYLGNQ